MATTPNFQPPPIGYGSYLNGILPNDVAVAAGSFAAAVQQVINVKYADFEKFAQVAASIEVTNTNLPLINGTDVPVNLQKTAEDSKIMALGSGPHGMYTASDFFGCMSGLPYQWRELRSTLLAAQTTKLVNIYDQLFLAVTWEGATVTVITETRTSGTPPSTYTEYRCAGFSISNKGGGYYRGTAPNPIITASNGGSGVGIVGTDPSDGQSIGNGTYGRVTGATLTSAGSWVLSPPTATIQYPPTATLPVLANGNKSTSGTNTATGTTGWPSPMNAVVQAYIDQANAEISYIASSKASTVKKLNTIYNLHGTQLEIEQRCRYQALTPVPLPNRDRFLSNYPGTISSFIDTMSTYAQSTRPHMYAQTLEAISDLTSVCGQSAVGLMRQERNIERLEKIGVSVENTIPGKLQTELEKPLISNGTLPIGKKGVGVDVSGINGNVADPVTTYTTPSNLVQTGNLSPKPQGYYNPSINKFIAVNNVKPVTQPESIANILALEKVSPTKNINLLGPNNDGTGPAKTIPSNIDPAMIQSGVANPGEAAVTLEPIAIVTVGASVPTGDGTVLDDGSATYPGSLAGSLETNLLPPNLNTAYTSSVLLPTTLSVAEAINEVIKCNCDCWVD